jgi:hypothetical protein
MTDLSGALDAYRRGLEEQIALLESLAACAAAQRHACERRDADALVEASAHRQRAMEALLDLEQRQRPLRDLLADDPVTLKRQTAFDTVSHLHRRAEAWLGEIDSRDRETRVHLDQTASARRASAMAIEAGEATLGAYRKTLLVNAPSSILDSHG